MTDLLESQEQEDHGYPNFINGRVAGSKLFMAKRFCVPVTPAPTYGWGYLGVRHRHILIGRDYVVFIPLVFLRSAFSLLCVGCG